MSSQNFAAIVSAFGGGTVIVLLVQALIRWITGRAGRELNQVEYERKLRREAEKRATDAEATADAEAVARRKQAEYSSTLRRKMIEYGVPAREIPPWPMDGFTITRRPVRPNPPEKEKHD